MNLRFLPLLLILITALGVKAQQYEDKSYYLIDSLSFSEISAQDSALVVDELAKFHAAEHDTDRLYALNTIVNLMISDTWGDYAEYMLDFTEELVNQEGNNAEEQSYYDRQYSGALNNYGMYISHHGDNEGAIELYMKSMKLAEERRSAPDLSAVYNNLAFQYEQLGRTQEALEYHHMSLKIDLQLNDTNGITSSYNNLALLYDNIDEIELAHKNYLKCYEYLKDGKDLWRLGITYGNIGASFANFNQMDSAIWYYNKAYEIQQTTEDKLGMSVTLGSIATGHLSKGDTAKAIESYIQSIQMAESIEYYKTIAGSGDGLSDIYLQMGKLNLAQQHAERSYRVALEKGFLREQSTSALTLYKIYEKQGKYKQALEMYVDYRTGKDSLVSIDNKTDAFKRDTELEYEQLALTDSLANAKEKELLNIRHQEREAKQQQRSVFLGIILVIIFLFFIFVLNRFRLTRKQKNIIEKQKMDVDQAYGELETKNKEILDSITYAKRIQNAILPPDKIVKEYLQESFILYIPKDIVAGDFYWLEQQKDAVLFAAADCTGHGVPGAMVSVVCHNALNRSVREYGLTKPGKILDSTRKIILEEFEKSEESVKDGMDIALCSLTDQTLHYAGAYNPLWIIRKGVWTEQDLNVNGVTPKIYVEDGYTLFEIKGDKQPVGKHESPVAFNTRTVNLEKNDRIYIFSDGYVDQFGGAKGKKLKAPGLKSLLITIQNLSMTQQRQHVTKAFEDWKGDLEQVDDVCLIGLEI